MRTTLITGALALGLLTFAFTPTASAYWRSVGRHALTPHVYRTLTPYRVNTWYGNGLHGIRPYRYSFNPYYGMRSYSYTPYGSTIIYNRYPYGYGYGYPYSYGYGYPYGYRSAYGYYGW